MLSVPRNAKLREVFGIGASRGVFEDAELLLTGALQHGVQHKICGQRPAVISFHFDEGRGQDRFWISIDARPVVGLLNWRPDVAKHMLSLKCCVFVLRGFGFHAMGARSFLGPPDQTPFERKPRQPVRGLLCLGDRHLFDDS
jgi:hypothetical protein